MPPVILGLILGPTIEKNLQKALVLSDGSFSIFFTHPISCVLIVIAVVSLMLPLITYFVKKKRGKNEEAAAE